MSKFLILSSYGVSIRYNSLQIWFRTALWIPKIWMVKIILSNKRKRRKWRSRSQFLCIDFIKSISLEHEWQAEAAWSNIYGWLQLVFTYCLGKEKTLEKARAFSVFFFGKLHRPTKLWKSRTFSSSACWTREEDSWFLFVFLFMFCWCAVGVVFVWYLCIVCVVFVHYLYSVFVIVSYCAGFEPPCYKI